MSVPVPLDQLRDAVDRYGPRPYLLTTGGDGRPHAVAVAVRWDGDRLVAGAGRTTARNVAARPGVCLLWPPVGEDRFSLLVDGAATLAEAGEVVVTPERAVLHRPPADPVITAEDQDLRPHPG